MKTILLFTAFLTAFTSCNRSKDVLLRINATAKVTDGNAIHNLIHTQNYTTINDSAVLNYLAKSAGKHTTFKHYKNVAIQGSYTLTVFLATKTTPKGDAHSYYLLLQDNRGTPVDIFEFAVWNDATGRYCSSVLYDNLLIERTCGTEQEIWNITDGRFMQLEE